MNSINLTPAEQNDMDAFVRNVGESMRFGEQAVIVMPSGKELPSAYVNALLDAQHGRHRHVSMVVRRGPYNLVTNL